MRILVLSAYHAASHQYWLDGLVNNFPEHQWTTLTLPARYFSWRIRGNSLSWALSEQTALNAEYDLLIATSMVDLSALRGLQPALTRIPTLVYFHENQFAYPMSQHKEKAAVEPQLVNLYTALCADQIVFNSHYNHTTFFAGVTQLLRNLPDAVPPNVVTQLEERSSVLAVPLKNEAFYIRQISSDPPREQLSIIWNHRWEYDKGPERLFKMVERLPSELPFTFHIVGQQFRQIPETMNILKTLLEKNNWLGAWGFIEDKRDYHQLLRDSDIVLSTALHDFQGLSILEACAANCVPMVPDRLAYHDFIPAHCRYASMPEDENAEADSAAKHLVNLYGELIVGADQSTLQWRELGWEKMYLEYQTLFQKTVRNAIKEI